MKILVTGAKGQLGQEMQKQLAFLNADFRALDRQELDIADKDKVWALIKAYRPDLVINCAAMNNLDACEVNEFEAAAINRDGPGNLAMATHAIGARMIHFSTDYVFSGSGHKDQEGILRPYIETDKPEPLSVYGQTKFEGELLVQANNPRHYIVRTAWLYGGCGNQFMKAILQKARTNDLLKVVDDQTGTPTSAAELTKAVLELLQTDNYGLFHGTNEGFCTRYEWAMAIKRLYALPAIIEPCSAKDYPVIARRPLWAVLENQRLKKETKIRFTHWQDALIRDIGNIT